jgi:outer membrane immunogenic protein
MGIEHTMRHSFLRLIAATGVSAMTGSIVMAADMGVVRKAPPPPVPVATWSGLYLGLGFGTRSTRTDVTVTAHTENGADTLAQNCAFLAPFGGCVSGEPMNDTGFRINPYAGFNWQVAPQWVVGIEADGGFGNKTTTLTGMRYPGSRLISTVAEDTFSVKTTWDASARGRVGFLPDPSVLVYATGGIAWLHVESTSNCRPTVCSGPGVFGPAAITDARTKTGWTVGGGLEAMLWANWIARAEYRYADFGTISHTDTRTEPGFVELASYDVRVRTHTATFGLAYKFDWNTPAAIAPVKAPIYKAPPAVALTSWSGVYAGLGVGTRSTRTEATVTDWTSTTGTSLSITCAFIAGFGAGSCLNREPLNDTAFRLSPYLGLNWQVAPQWVVGVEGDWGFADKTATLTGVTYPASGLISATAPEHFSVKTTWDASARGRIGFLTSPSVLVYATGGVAWLHVESTSTCNVFNSSVAVLPCLNGFTPLTITNSHTKTGWTVGGGLEAMLWGNWIARGEYRYADFGTISNTDVRTVGADVFTVNYDLRIRAHTATFGLAYKFDWGRPVIAKY